MKKYKIISVWILLLSLFSCEPSGVGETVETANILLPQPDIPYKFSRNGLSSVDVYDVNLLTEDLDDLSRRIGQGDMHRKLYFEEFMKVYTEGRVFVAPESEVASSEFADTQQVRADVRQFIERSRQIEKQQAATEGVFGYIGGKVGFKQRIYVDDKGLAFVEVFRNMLTGAVYLDKILNVHLNEKLFDDAQLRANHENLELVTGKNYTELEHHWDMAYGYFSKIQSLTQANGLPELKGVERKILDAFAWGRIELGNYRYLELQEQLLIIRKELSRAFAIRTVEKLAGKITEVNYREDPKQAFKYLSQAYAMIYALQFTRKADGSSFFSYDEVVNLQKELVQGTGLWDTERILGEEQAEGSLKNIAKEIKVRYEL